MNFCHMKILELKNTMTNIKNPISRCKRFKRRFRQMGRKYTDMHKKAKKMIVNIDGKDEKF